MVVFEDDGETGYLYGVERSQDDTNILDVLHIYNAKDVADSDRPSVIEIVWTEDGLKACLVINRFPHAAFDFASKRAYGSIQIACVRRLTDSLTR